MSQASSKDTDDYDEGVEEDFIMLDIRPNSTMDSIAEKVFGDITKASAGKQFLVGGAAGWVSGYMANRVGKIAAISIAGSLLVFQIAQHNNYITVDWTRVHRDMTKVRNRLQSALTRQTGRFRRTLQSLSKDRKAQTFYEENFFLASGFATGMLFGFFW